VPAMVKGLSFQVTLLGNVFASNNYGKQKGQGQEGQGNPIPVGPKLAKGGIVSAEVIIAGKNGTATRTATGAGAGAGAGLGQRNGFTRHQLPKEDIHTDRLSPVSLGADNQRIDRKIRVDEAVQARIRKSDLCPYLYLRRVYSLEHCRRNHVHRRLTKSEFDALLALTRTGKCYRQKRNTCLNPLCIYGHDG